RRHPISAALRQDGRRRNRRARAAPDRSRAGPLPPNRRMKPGICSTAKGVHDMTTIVKIDGEAIGLTEFMRTLKLTGQFEGLIEQLVRDRLTVRGARKHGIRLSVD